MKIAINIPFPLRGSLDSNEAFNIELFKKIAQKDRSKEFIILLHHEVDLGRDLPENVKTIFIKNAGKNSIQWKLLYDFRIPAILKKQQVDLLVSTEGICSLRTKIPQLLFVHDLSYLHFPKLLPKYIAAFYRRNTPGFVKKAITIIVPSIFARDEIHSRYKITGSKIEVIPQAPPMVLKPLSWEGKVRVKQHYADGKEFFLFAGTLHPANNLIQLLKAFSIFKKRQKSNTLLLIVGERGRLHESFLESFRHYKFKNEVKLMENVPAGEMTEILGAANAFVYPSLYGGFALPVLQAMQAGVPVLASKKAAIPETAGGAAILFDPNNVDEISTSLMDIYKNENLRAELVSKGMEWAKNFTLDKSAERMLVILQQLKQV